MLGVLSVFIVVLMSLCIDTCIDKAPVIFLSIAEWNSGQIDVVISPSSYEAKDDLNVLYDYFYYRGYLNSTQMRSVVPGAKFTPRKMHEGEFTNKAMNETHGT